MRAHFAFEPPIPLRTYSDYGASQITRVSTFCVRKTCTIVRHAAQPPVGIAPTVLCRSLAPRAASLHRSLVTLREVLRVRIGLSSR